MVITPWWVIHRYSHALVAEFLQVVVVHGVHNVIKVQCKVQLSSMSLTESFHDEAEARQADKKDTNLPNQSCLKGVVGFFTMSLWFGGPSASPELRMLPTFALRLPLPGFLWGDKEAVECITCR